jgi:hypothetical protein
VSGYFIAMAPCIACGRLFSFNPDLVPSTTALTGQREPVCSGCMAHINAKRQRMGLEPFVILPGAYGPQEGTP